MRKKIRVLILKNKKLILTFFGGLKIVVVLMIKQRSQKTNLKIMKTKKDAEKNLVDSVVLRIKI